MLLLVLILVLIAFGILVVALFSGSVLLAWIAVAIALAAAAVLGYDWVQRRAAVRSGPGDGAEEGAAAPAYADPEPATEVIPLVPPRRPPASAEDGRGTVVIPAWEPSGADRAPSGAGAGNTPSRGSQSRSVVESRVDNPEVASGPEAAAGPSGGARSPDDEATVVVEGLAGTVFDAAPEEAAERPADRSADRAPDRAGAEEPAPPGGPTADAAPPPERPAGAAAPPPDGPPEAAAPPPHGPAPDDAAAPAPQQPAAYDPAELPPLGPDGAPPEEPYDPDVAAVVARLEDEVVVIDEMPRYHLGGCPALTGATGIPLPAREAVELGFTPCGWCAPDRALVARHPAAAR